MLTKKSDLGSAPVGCGSYVLLLWQPRLATLEIGRLGSLAVARGWYAYVGSAMGPGGVRARLRHHTQPVVHPHWHLDYLRATAYPREAWFLTSPERRETDWAMALAGLPGATVSTPGFGATDSPVASHLMRFCRRPHFRDWAAYLKLRFPDDPPLVQVVFSLKGS